MDTKIILGDARYLDISLFPCQYGVIIADPPWPYRISKGQGTAIDQYNLMTDDELLKMPVSRLANTNSVLFLWGTWPKLSEAMAVMAAWQFDYITGFPWVKLNKNGHGINYGVGYWVRGCSEFILIGKRGNVSPPRLEGFLGLLSPNIEHSRKPNDIHEIAESLPGPYLELFARRSRIGWHVFGNDIDTQTFPTKKKNCRHRQLDLFK